MNYKAILWDNDGTLVNTEPLYFKSCEQVLAEEGLVLDRQWYLGHAMAKGKSAFEIATKAGLSSEAISKIRDRRNVYYSEYIEKGVVVMPGVVETLEALYGRVKMGVVTDSRREHFEKIMRVSCLSRYFDFFVTIDDAGRGKPDPAGYLQGIELSGFSAHECIAIEDTQRGLEAAVAAGLDCYVIPNDMTKGSDFLAAKGVLGSANEILDLV